MAVGSVWSQDGTLGSYESLFDDELFQDVPAPKTSASVAPPASSAEQPKMSQPSVAVSSASEPASSVSAPKSSATAPESAAAKPVSSAVAPVSSSAKPVSSSVQSSSAVKQSSSSVVKSSSSVIPKSSATPVAASEPRTVAAAETPVIRNGKAEVRLYRIEGWHEHHGEPEDIPVLPGHYLDTENAELIPYAKADKKISMFPRINPLCLK